MCGFYGYTLDGQFENASALISLSCHRGPDDQHAIAYAGTTLAFNRLAILDLSPAGRQPMQSPDGRWTLVFNGEVYNHQELRSGLDYHFKGHSDSESILASLTVRGFEDTVQRLNGMFAIAAWDEKTQTLWLARDFAGIKPLFYGVRDGAVVFASQFNQVFLHPLFRQDLELIPEELKSYFALGYMQAPGTVFRDIYQVEPGEIVRFSLEDKRLVKKRFLCFPVAGRPELDEWEDEAVHLFNRTFSEVVRDQLVADVPVAVFLSGGIDSPLVAAHARATRADVVAYTIGVDDPEMDETEAARRYAGALGLRHEVRTFTQNDLLEVIDDHFEKMGEPFGDYSSLPTYLISRIAAREHKVMLSGDGGDELFWGYPRFLKTVQHRHWYRMPQGVRRLAAAGVRRMGLPVSYGVSAFEEPDAWILRQHIHQPGDLLDRAFDGTPFPQHVHALYHPPRPLRTHFDTLQFLRWNEFYAHLQRVLTKVDRASMANSLEVRVPFLDRRIIEFAWRLRPGLGKHHREPKLLLKKALAQKVGVHNVTRRKKGFGVPIRAWLRHELREEVADLLLASDWYGSQCFDVRPLKQAVADFLDHDRGNEWGIWILYAWQKWARQNGLN